MLDFTAGTQVYLACGVTDLRKSFNGLTAIVKLRFKLDPYSKSMFVFCNRNRTLIKILQWDGSGLWLFMKRLDKGNFRWPMDASEVKQISIKELRWLLDGLTIE
ncbi:MAG: IS66 family insertion sequence element accessory protein TnpB [Clostridiaceae bacterium]|nr:IS66 family insertion sequence element accessory protein TnpB [Clostridiaceae bacterium]